MRALVRTWIDEDVGMAALHDEQQAEKEQRQQDRLHDQHDAGHAKP